MGTFLYFMVTAALSLGGCGIVWGCTDSERRFWDWWDSNGVPVFMVFFLFIGYWLAGPSDPRFWDGMDY